jgi:hypothetical protein
MAHFNRGIRDFLLKKFFNPLELYALNAYGVVIGKSSIFYLFSSLVWWFTVAARLLLYPSGHLGS